MGNNNDKGYLHKPPWWQIVTTFGTLMIAVAAVVALIITIHYNSKLIKESIEARVAENRPLIVIRRCPLSGTEKGGMQLEIKNVGKGNAYNITYSYHYYDFLHPEVMIYETGQAYSSPDCFAVLEPGKVLNYYSEEDRKRFGIRERDGLPFIHPYEKTEDIQRTLNSSIVACAVYVEYEDFKGNKFWSARQFGIKFSRTQYPLSSHGPYMQYRSDERKARGAFIERANERAVKGARELRTRAFETPDVMQTEKLTDTLWKKDLK